VCGQRKHGDAEQRHEYSLGKLFLRRRDAARNDNRGVVSLRRPRQWPHKRF
jgi:hypothetical protein